MYMEEAQQLTRKQRKKCDTIYSNFQLKSLIKTSFCELLLTPDFHLTNFN